MTFAERRSEGFPDENEHVTYNNVNRATILAMINNVFQEGVTESFPCLPALLAVCTSLTPSRFSD